MLCLLHSRRILPLAGKGHGSTKEPRERIMAVSTSRFALIDDTVLNEEDPETRDLEQALRWVRTYAELLTFAVRLQAEQPAPSMGLRRQAEMYTRRLTLWKERCRAIADR